jgi:hypothetical protein
MPQRVVYLLFLFFALLSAVSCSNDENDEGLEVITPNDPAETGTSQSETQAEFSLKPVEKKAEPTVITRS